MANFYFRYRPDLAQRLRSHILSLMNLGPAIENTLAQAERRDVDGVRLPVSIFNVSEPAKPYVSSVRDKFREAPVRLVERLGEANWQRHIVVRTQMAKFDEESGGDIQLPDSKQDVFSAFGPVSIFHDSGIGTSISASSQYAASVASHTSFASSLATEEKGSVRVPPTPVEVGVGKPFRCRICGIAQYRIRNRLDWKYVSLGNTCHSTSR